MKPEINGITHPFLIRTHCPSSPLRETYREGYVKVGEIGAVYFSYIAVYNSQRYVTVRYHCYEFLRDESIFGYGLVDYSTSQFLVKIDESLMVLGVGFNIDLFANELRYILDQFLSSGNGLHEHLVSHSFRATICNAGVVFACHRYFVSRHVDFPGIKHCHKCIEVRGRDELYRNASVFGKTRDEVIIVAHWRFAINKI